jgi:hypothetical protein
MTTTGKEQEPAETYEVQLGRRLSASQISMKLGISYQTAYKNYCAAPRPLGDYWRVLAKLVTEHMLRADDEDVRGQAMLTPDEADQAIERLTAPLADSVSGTKPRLM